MSPLRGPALAGLAALHLVRAQRPSDRPLAFIAVVGTVGWLLVALGFGLSIGNVLDPRALMHAVVSCVLVGFGVRTLVHANDAAPAAT